MYTCVIGSHRDKTNKTDVFGPSEDQQAWTSTQCDLNFHLTFCRFCDDSDIMKERISLKYF